ncbi:phosphatidylinositol 3,4,5-trisphosphate 3-phosphatase and protein-tyrosine-phosphatase [Canna indica]|uniref:Phosphatidylinositol 3,4,5-trisphosphate 3-phosphatase and protein-tyrosine-phosphatase n=1 Tax=Canna indica TaxID=4628 RepID=A0AAQ3L0F1_9LILI|nr:phosphatidylinositol 3,4,5-trisphosphate 3-phosphatase and protein-tyrosine-phosphatase [Canna indica]
MESQQLEQPSPQPVKFPENQSSSRENAASPRGTQSTFSASGISSWARNIKLPQSSGQENLQSGSPRNSTFSRFTSGLSFRLSPKSSQSEEIVAENTSSSAQPGVLGSLTKGLVDTSKSAVKSVQVKARHMVSQNKRRYQEGGFDLDMTYITENIIAMGFPAGDMSSGFFGYVEGFYRNHMEEVIKFFETHHKGKYKVYNLCSERLYDPSLFEGKVACFPFDDHNCPPVQLIISFCQSAYSWLKEDIENVVAVHCKAGMARTGLMISSLLLYLKFFPTAEESMDYYNQKRCMDGKGLVLPSQIRYVKYFERILKYFNGENQPGRRCMIRGFRLHRCPRWIRPSITISNHDGVLFSTKKHPRTKNLMPEDFWFTAPRNGIMVFALPGEPGLAEVTGDFKIHFHAKQGDFYCWLNTTFTENRKMLNTSDLDGFDKRKLPSPGFQIEVVLVDYDGSNSPRPVGSNANMESAGGTTPATATESITPTSKVDRDSKSNVKDEVFSDGEAEESESAKSRHNKMAGSTEGSTIMDKETEMKVSKSEVTAIAKSIDQVSLEKSLNAADVKIEGNSKNSPAVLETPKLESTSMSEFKAIAADASVFSFGDEEDYESE